MESLVEDLGRGQVPSEPHLAGSAKRAGERAPGLRGETERSPAVPVTHEDGLERVAVAGPKQRLQGAVASSRLVLELERRERHLVLEFAA